VKKLADFIVNKRNIIIILFIILSVICAILSQKVKINDDITKYLPSNSETRIGMDKMEEEFTGEEDSSSFNIMFKGLTEDEKQDIYKQLENKENIASVDYDNTEDYNKDDYTLYTINVDDASDSELAKNVYEGIKEDYKHYNIETDGEIAEENKVVLPTWILVVAVTGVLIILLLMCESYVEPFLFLFSILIAILLNNGTNIIFDKVSNITSSISAILQLALSMDYSIMLMNRYRQEKETDSDSENAMKKALHNSIQSISSSSLTTIVGLVCLVFMSFTIGRDLGLVLAKGVLFSLISVFCVLPGLILMFDNLIAKTQKKTPNIRLDKLGKISYKLKYPATIAFLGVFAVSYLLKGNLNIAYTSSDNDEVSKVFGSNNQIAIIYNTEDEEKVAKHLSELENDNVDDVLGYSNTINEELKYDELVDKLNDLGSDTEIEDYLLKIIYYKYYNQDENNTMTFDELVKFVQTEVYSNKDLDDELSDSLKKDVERLSNFTDKTKVNQKRNSENIAEILGMEKSDVDDILVYYNSKNNNLQISLKEFVDFMNNTVLNDDKYASNISKETRESLEKLTKFTNKSTITTKYTSSEMASLFGMSENDIKDLYVYYISVNEIGTKLSLSEFSNFVLSDVLTNDTYKNMFTEDTINSIKLLATYSNKNTINKSMTASEISSLLGIDESSVNALLLLKYMNVDSGSTYTIPEVINTSVYLKNNTNYLEGTDISIFEKLSIFTKNENNIDTTKLNKTNLATIFDNISNGLVNDIYYLAGLIDQTEFTPQEFVKYVLNLASIQNANTGVDAAVYTIDNNTVNSLKLLESVIDETVSSTPQKYTASQIANIFGTSKTSMYNLYALFDYSNGKTNNWKSTPYEFVGLILNNKDKDQIKNSISSEQLQSLTLLNNIMTSSLNEVKYTYFDLASFIGSDNNSIKNIYVLYENKNSTLQLTPQEFTQFILNHKNDSTLNSRLSQDTISSLELLQTVMTETINNTKYSSQNLSNLLSIDKDSLDLIYGLYVSKSKEQTISLNELIDFVVDDVMNSSDYSSSFDASKKLKLNTVRSIIKASMNGTKYTKDEMIGILSNLSDELENNTLELVYLYFGSSNEYNENWKLTVEQIVKYLNDDILQDNRFTDFIDEDMRNNITDSKDTIEDAKELLVGNKYSRVVLNTSMEAESEETFNYVQKIKDILNTEGIEFYVIGDSPMAYEMSKTFVSEFNYISILTMIAIFVVVALTFKSLIIPIILVGVIQCAVYLTMGILAVSGGSVYFIALLIVQSILMGSTIDYAILYTSYYIEERRTKNKKDAIIEAYNQSIHTILTSGSILVIVTFIVGMFASAITAKICITLCKGTLCSIILILLFLPAILGTFDKFVVKK
jgi:predicted RND superfamily exporter protein